MSALRRLFFLSVCCGLLAGLAVAQSTSLSLGTSVTDFQLQGGGGASIVLPYVSQARRYGNDARHDARISRC